jgi:hypothetical protein
MRPADNRSITYTINLLCSVGQREWLSNRMTSWVALTRFREYSPIRV